MTRRSLLFACLFAATSAAAADSPTFFVAPPPLGSDTHDGTAHAPFATLDRARRAVRHLLATAPQSSDLLVELHAGTYELATPVRFEPADSGTNGFTITYRGAPGTSVILSGGRSVTGWTHEHDGVYRAPIDPTIDFRQLWVDDRRAVRARRPDIGATFQFAAEKHADGFDLPPAHLADVALRPNEVEFSVLIAWMHKRLRLARLEPTADPNLTRAVIAPGEWDAITKQPQGDRVYIHRHYWLEGAREFLDAPGEFHLDRAGGAVRYRPRAGEDLSRATIIRPELENLIRLEGRLDAPVHHLRFENLTFAHTGWTRPNAHGFVDVQANSLIPAEPTGAADEQYRHRQRKDRIPAAFQASTADAIVVRGCRFTRLGGAGVMFTGGGNDNVIEGNSFVDLAAGGIEFGEDAARPANPRLFPRRNRIANNFLAHLGEDYFGSVAILGYYTDASVIIHNEIAAVPYTGISQGWGWGQPSAPPDSRANRITHNRVTDFMRRLDDGGGIYTTDRQPGSEIAHNHLARMLPPDPHSKAGGALYPDQFTEGFHVHHNVVTEAPRWLFLWNPNIRGNRIDANYADTAALRNDGPDNEVEAVNLFAPAAAPAPVTAIIAAAGLEPAFAQVRETSAPRATVVESTSVDFQPVTGTWTIAPSDSGYSAHRQQSSSPDAAARLTPLLPATGAYEVRVWRPFRAAAATFTLLTASGESRVSLPAASAPSEWVSLGTHRFFAGAGADVTITAASSETPLVVDVIEFRPATR